MTRALLSILVLLNLATAHYVFAEGTRLSVDSDVMDELMSEKAAAPPSVSLPQETSHKGARIGKRSQFAQLRENFAKAASVGPEDFKGDAVFVGECVSKNSPDKYRPAIADLYVERIPKAGLQVFLVPKIEEGKPGSRDYASLDETALRTHHEGQRKEKAYFTALQFGGTVATLSGLLSSAQKSSAFFTYPVPRRKVAATPAKKGSTAGQAVLYSLRMDRDPSGNPYLLLQRLCPYSPGCSLPSKNVVDYLKFEDAYGLCKYSQTHYLVGRK